MSVWIEAAAILCLFVLRLGVPLAITMLVGHFLCRLDMKWQAEAAERRKDRQAGAPIAPGDANAYSLPAQQEKAQLRAQ